MTRARLLIVAFAAFATVAAAPALSDAQNADPPPLENAGGEPPGSPAQPAPPPTTPSGPTTGPSPGATPAAEADPPKPAAPAQPQSTRAKAQPAPQASPAASLSVSIGDNFYSPAQVTIDAGDAVTWANDGQAPHSATANDGSFDTGVFNPGQSRSATFSQAGTFSYFCTVHGQAQSGTVVVRDAGAAPGPDATDTGASEDGGTDPVTSAGTGPTLPETGLAVLLLAAIGSSLLGSGVALRRRKR